jgi:hypothetical protein
MIIQRFEIRKSQRFEGANYRKTRKSHGKNTLVSSRFSLKNNTLKKHDRSKSWLRNWWSATVGCPWVWALISVAAAARQGQFHC